MRSRSEFFTKSSLSASGRAAGIAIGPQPGSNNTVRPLSTAATAARDFTRLEDALGAANSVLESANFNLSALWTLVDSTLGAPGRAYWMRIKIISRSITRFASVFFLFSSG